MSQDAPSLTTDATTSANTGADAPKKRRRPIFRDPLAITAVCLAVVVSVANYLIGGYPEMYVLEDFQQMPKSQLATIETQLQLRVAKEQILRPTGQPLSCALGSLGFLKLNQGNKKEAIRFFEKAIANQDYGVYDDPVRYYLGRLYLSEGRIDDAVALMVKWRGQLNTNVRDATGELVAFHQLDADIMQAAGKKNAANQARALEERCLRTPLYLSFNTDTQYSPSSSVLRSLFEQGCALLAADRYAESKRVFNMTIKGLPDVKEDLQARSEAILMLPVVDYCAGDWSAAEKDFALAASQPDDGTNTATAVFYHYYSEYLRRKGMTRQADQFAAKELAVRQQRNRFYSTRI